MRVEKHFRKKIQRYWLAMNCGRLCTNRKSCLRFAAESYCQRHKLFTNKASGNLVQPPLLEWQGEAPEATGQQSGNRTFCLFDTSGITWCVAFICVTFGLMHWHLCFYERHVWLSIAISNVSVGWKGGRIGKLSKIEPISRKGKTTTCWYLGRSFTNHQVFYPHAFLLETFYSLWLQDSNNLQGFIAFTLKQQTFSIISMLFRDHNLLNAMNNHISQGLL